MKRLPHPNIVAYKDSFAVQGGDKLCIVMTYCDGGDLSARLEQQRGKLLAEDQILHWFVQMALGLGCMHAGNILHRDLKTANIFLLTSGRLVLGDLGISKSLDATMAMASTQIGTPYYMSPELFQSKAYNHKSDVWALGCVLYEMCTLRHPFEAESIQQLGARILRGRFPPIATRFSRGLRSLIDSMLDLSPASRPSVEDVLRSPFMRKPLTSFVRDMAKRAAAASPGVGMGTMAFGSALHELAAPSPDVVSLGPHSASLFNQLRSMGLSSLAAKAVAPVLPAVAKPEGRPATDVSPALAPAPASRTARREGGFVPAVGRASSKPSGAIHAAARPQAAQRVLREQQAELWREKEVQAAVERALSRFSEEKRQRAQWRKRQLDARRRAGAGAAVPGGARAAAAPTGGRAGAQPRTGGSSGAGAARSAAGSKGPGRAARASRPVVSRPVGSRTPAAPAPVAPEVTPAEAARQRMEEMRRQEEEELASWRAGRHQRAQLQADEAAAASKARHATGRASSTDARTGGQHQRAARGAQNPSGSSRSDSASARERVLARRAEERQSAERQELARLDAARRSGAAERRAVADSRRGHFSGAAAARSVNGAALALPGSRYGSKPPRHARGVSVGAAHAGVLEPPVPAAWRSLSAPDEPYVHHASGSGAKLSPYEAAGRENSRDDVADEVGLEEAPYDEKDEDVAAYDEDGEDEEVEEGEEEEAVVDAAVLEVGMDADLEAAAAEDEVELAAAAAELKAVFEASLQRCDKLHRSIQQLRRRALDGAEAQSKAAVATPPHGARGADAPPAGRGSADEAARAGVPRMSPGTEALLLAAPGGGSGGGEYGGYGYEGDDDAAEVGEAWGDDWAVEWGDGEAEEGDEALEADDAVEEPAGAESGYLGRRAAAVRAEVEHAVGSALLEEMLAVERRRLHDDSAEADAELARRTRALEARLGGPRVALLQRVRELVHVESVLAVA